MRSGRDLWSEFETLTNRNDSAGLASLFASDGVLVGPNFRHEGSEAIRAFCDVLTTHFSDINMETSLVIEEGETVVAEWTVRATHMAAPAMPDGTSATDMTVAQAGVTVGTVRDGKFLALREYFDTAPR